MKQNILKYLAIFLALAVLILIATLIFGSKDVSKIDLLSDDTSDLQTQEYRELYRGAQKNDPQILDEALALAQNRSANKRERAATLLGLYNDSKSLAALSELLNDKNEMVRVKAIHSISLTHSPERERLLINHISNKSFGDLEKAHLYSSLYNLSSEDKIKSNAIDHLLYIVSQSEHINAKRIASASLSQIPNHLEKISSTFQRAIFLDDPIVVSNIIRYFSHTKDTWFKTNASQFYTNKSLDESIQQSLIETMHILCPKNRFRYMRSYLESGNQRLADLVIKNSLFHTSNEMTEILSHLASSSENKETKRLAQEYLNRMKKENRQDRCR